MVQKHFKQLNLSESTVCYFRKKYLIKVAKQAKVGDSSVLTTGHCKAWTKGCTRRSARCQDQTIQPTSYVKMGQLSVSVLFRQLLKATYSVVTTLCSLSMVDMIVCLTLDWAHSLCEDEGFNKGQLETSCG